MSQACSRIVIPSRPPEDWSTGSAARGERASRPCCRRRGRGPASPGRARAAVRPVRLAAAPGGERFLDA